MGTLCGSGTARSATNSTQNVEQQQSYAPNAAVVGAGTEAVDMARSAATQPFQMPAAPVAQFNPFQQQSFNQLLGIQGATSPYYANARDLATRAGTEVNANDINQYMSPYADATLANMKKYIFDPQRTATMGRNQQLAGGVGSERLALVDQNLSKTQGDAMATAMQGFYQPAMNMAQAQKQQALQTAQGWANLGMGDLSGRLQETGALMGAGNQQQAQTQAELMSPYQQALAKLAYPYQNAQFLAGITGGIAPSMGGTTTGYSNTAGTSNTTSQAAQPSPLNQILGLGTAAAGMYFGIPGMSTALGGMFGGSGSGGSSPYTVQSFDSYGNPNYGRARGGAITRAAGGAVNPWDFAQGFAPGGDVEEYTQDQFNPIDAAAPDYSRPIEGPAPNLGMWPFNRGKADYKGDVTMFPPSGVEPAPLPPSPWAPHNVIRAAFNAAPTGTAQAKPAPAPPAAVDPLSEPGPFKPPIPTGPSFASRMPGYTGTPAYTGTREPPVAPPAPPPRQVATGPDRAGDYRRQDSDAINTDMKISDYQTPASQRPYPDALKRDWGQNLARSPWLSLIEAGAKMAQHVGPPGSAIGAGVHAGVGTLTKQREELQSEQKINQKADELYRHAREELNKYTRMTPYHQELLNRERFQWQPGMGVDPDTGQTVPGAYRLPTAGGDKPQFFPNAAITGGRGGAGGGSTALKKNVEYLVESGIAPGNTLDEKRAAAFNMIHQSVNSPIMFQRLVQAQEKILQNDRQWMKDPAGRRAEAERIVRTSQQEVQRLGSGAAAAPASSSTGPAVGERKQFKQGWGTWDGTKWTPD